MLQVTAAWSNPPELPAPPPPASYLTLIGSLLLGIIVGGSLSLAIVRLGGRVLPRHSYMAPHQADQLLNSIAIALTTGLPALISSRNLLKEDPYAYSSVPSHPSESSVCWILITLGGSSAACMVSILLWREIGGQEAAAEEDWSIHARQENTAYGTRDESGIKGDIRRAPRHLFLALRVASTGLYALSFSVGISMGGDATPEARASWGWFFGLQGIGWIVYSLHLIAASNPLEREIGIGRASLEAYTGLVLISFMTRMRSGGMGVTGVWDWTGWSILGLVAGIVEMLRASCLCLGEIGILWGLGWRLTRKGDRDKQGGGTGGEGSSVGAFGYR